MTPTSFKTNITTPTGKPLAEWFSLNSHPPADRRAIAADIGAVISAVVPTLCVCCDAVATVVMGDWDVCEAHYEALSGPEGEEEPELYGDDFYSKGKVTNDGNL